MSSAELRSDGLEVAVIPENRLCARAGDIQRASVAPGAPLLGCVDVNGTLELWDPADREGKPGRAEGQFRDFQWEEASVHSSSSSGSSSDPRSSSRILAVGSDFDLKLLEVSGNPSSISLLCLCEYSAEKLLQAIKEKNPSVSELLSLHVLSWASGCCCVVINSEWILQLQWQKTEEEEKPEIVSCFRIQLNDKESETPVHLIVCRETLFTITTKGLIYVFNLFDGSLLASVDLPSYSDSGLEDDDLSSSPPSSLPPPASYVLVQVSSDLSTAVAFTDSHTAVAIDLNHYFRLFPKHLLCASSPERPSLHPLNPRDQDSAISSKHCLSALGVDFSTDRSWESRLASIAPWWSSLPHLSSHHASLVDQSRVPPKSLTMSFSVPDVCSPHLLTVSEFSALITFVAPGNAETTVALWEFESGKVSYHTAEGEAAPVQRCGEKHVLLLKDCGLFQVLFSVSQQDLLSRLMLFGSAATVDAVCNLNNWGRCSIPVHSLQAGLKNRQLDTVDFYLKSKENVLSPSEQQTGASLSLTERVQQLIPALNLLCSAVRDSNSEAQSRQFSEQLLHITLNFLHSQIRALLSDQHSDRADVHSCVEVLAQYLTLLRSFMKRFPWTSSDSGGSRRDENTADEWDQLPTQEVVRASILTNQIPRAQAVLRRRGQSEHRLAALTREGLRQVYSSLQQRDLKTANALLVNMGFSIKKKLHVICQYTDDKELREFVVEELLRRNYFTDEEAQHLSFIREMERLGSLPVLQSPLITPTPRALHMVHTADTSEEVLKELVVDRRFEDSGLWVNVRLDWVKNWEQSNQTEILLSRLKHTELTSCDASVLWRYLTSLHDERRVGEWVQSSGAPQWPDLTPELVNESTACSTFMREDILDQLARRGVLIPDELCDLERLMWRVAQSEGIMSQSGLIPLYRASRGLDFHSVFIRFCLDHGLKFLLYSYLQHLRLTPRNCPLLTNRDLFESHPWFEMLVRIQEITTDLSGLVFQASLTSAQVLLPGSQAALGSLLLEGHSLLALASIMFAPGGIDQVRVRLLRENIDPQLLKMALSPYPKLKAALFPTGSRGNHLPQDVSVYHLLQSLHPLDPSKLFSWQTGNTLNSTETSELPHFSSPALVSKFALVENLDFLYFLRHGRPSVAFATFLLQHLNGCSDIKRLLQEAWHQVYRLAVQFFSSPSVGAAAPSARVDLRVLNNVLQHWSQTDAQSTPTQHLQTLVSKGLKLVEAESGAAEELIGHLEAAVCDSLEQKGVGRCSYEAALEWSVAVQFCQVHHLRLSSVFPSHCAQDGHFIHFLLFVQLHNFPPQQGAERLSCLCVWVLTSVNETIAGKATSHLNVAPQHHDWTLHDLSIIWRTLLGRGQVTPLLRGFHLFQRDCPLVLVLRMFELCCDYKNFTEAKAKLLEFQKTLIALRSSGPAPPGGLPLQWVESQASVLLLTMLQRCSSQFDLHRLLQLLADVNKLLKSNGPDFRKLSQLSQLLQGSDVSLSPRLLQCTSHSEQQVELQAIVDALQSRGRYSQARQVSQLAGLPLDRLLLSQLEQEVNSLREKRQWKRLETRVNFWTKSHQQLQTDCTDPESAAQFILSQCQTLTSDPSVAPEDAQTQLLDIQEKCLLIGLASHWLSLISPVPISRLEDLEKELWLNKVRQKILTTAIERESVFNLPQTVSSELNTYEALVKEFSFSNISSLNTVSYLSLEGLPNADSSGALCSSLGTEEQNVLTALVGQLLDQGSIHEASRVCRYFGLFHRDVWLVLRCRALASGEISPEQMDQDTDAEPRSRMPSSASFSSLPRSWFFLFLKMKFQFSFRNSSIRVATATFTANKCSAFTSSQRSCSVRLLRRAQAFIRAQGLSSESVAQLVSTALVNSLLASTQELQPEHQVFRPSEGRDSLMQLLKLCDDPNLVGNKLLESVTTVPLRDLNCIVELLIVAHDCFSLTCHMEGIVRVLQAARHLSHSHLASGEHYSLLVRLLTGIGRYNEMTYIFDLLHQNHRFEMLLRKKTDIDRGQSSGLKTALLDYLKRCLPGDSEKHNMVALCFSMRREIGENHEMAARTLLKMIESQDWVVTPDLKSSLEKVQGLLKDAAESFTKDSCVRQATRCVKMAKLVALQLHFIKQNTDLKIINLKPTEMLPAAIALPRCFQVFVLSEAYSYSPDWAEILFQRVVLKGDFAYLEEFKRHRPLSTALFEEIFKKLDAAPGNSTANVKKLLSHCEDVYSRYKLAYEQKLFDVTQALLQDKNTASYLHDRLAR
ncbi:hypothetical protein WMY93_023218 [Mugilogobius chulae]|uniref:Spatacsin C-terminal domain-containing protein n=1 Tax=Mugilogobius chulae TaxID=88201 RepID=A0AAW0NEQ1_9GOBI